MKLSLRVFVAGAVFGGLGYAIASNPKPFIDVCGTIFNNNIAKGAGIGFVGGALVAAGLEYRESRLPHQGGTHASMGAGFAKAFAIWFAPPIIGTLGGALIGGALSLSKHVVIQIK